VLKPSINETGVADYGQCDTTRCDMSEQAKTARRIAGALFVSLFLLWGSGYNTFGVFFTPLLRQFHRSHAAISLCATAIVLFTGAVAPVAGWLIQLVDVRVVMGAGATLAGASLLGISRAASFNHLLIWYVLLGVGLGGSTMVPASLILTNWFHERRGTVLGVATAGMELGGMIMTLLSARLISTQGWRTAYVVLALPVFFIVLPLIMLVIRARPQPNGAEAGQGARVLAGSSASPVALEPGLEVGEALRKRSFWLLGLAQFCFGLGVAGALIHLVPLMLKAKYSVATGALALSSVHALITVGKPTMGVVGDSIGARRALACGFAVCALGILLMGDAARSPVLALGIFLYAFTLATPIALVPVILLEIAGSRSFGTLFGLLFFVQTVGAAIGPIIVGWVFDVTGSYVAGYTLSAAIFLGAAVSILGCVEVYRPVAAEVMTASD
jgi:MFS family permease